MIRCSRPILVNKAQSDHDHVRIQIKTRACIHSLQAQALACEGVEGVPPVHHRGTSIGIYIYIYIYQHGCANACTVVYYSYII